MAIGDLVNRVHESGGEVEEGDVLCLGLTPCIQRTLVFHHFEPGEVNRALEVVETASGKATNVARVIKQLGGSALCMGFSGGEQGKRFLGHLRWEKLPYRFLEVEVPMRICQTLTSRDGTAVTELVEEAPLPEPESFDALKEMVESILPKSSLLVISGSPPKGSRPDFYRELIESAHHLGKPVFLDTQKKPLLEALEAKPFLVKLNYKEVLMTLGMESDGEDPVEVCQELRRKGAQNLIVTDGERDVFYFGEQVKRFKPPTVNHYCNPTGSGDAFSAGVVFSLGTHPGDWDRAVRWGMACGAANVMTETSGMVKLEEVEAILKQVGQVK